MALTRHGNAQVAAVLNATKGVENHCPNHISGVIVQINQLSINNRRHLFATTGKNSMLQLALREPSDLYLTYMLEQHASDPSLPLDVGFILHYSIDQKKVSVIALLLAHGADANDKTAGYPPLHACLYQPNRPAETLRIAEMLMEHNADLTYTNDDGVTTLMLAASNHPSLVTTILERLRAAGHDVSKYVQVCDGKGRSALHYATGGNRNAHLRHADVDEVTSLCNEGADLYARDYDGRDAFMACCYWLMESSQSVHWTARQVWSRINYWIDVFQPSLVRQWQVWELVGAQASLDQHVADNDEQSEDEEELEVKNQNPEPETPNDTDEIKFYERALTLRQQFSPEDILPIPVIPLFATYVEPVTVEALRQLRDDYSLMMQHAVQVIRRHLGDNSLAVSSALNKYAEYLENSGSAQRAFECQMLALKSMNPISDLLRIKEVDKQQVYAYRASLANHLFSASFYFNEVYNNQRRLRVIPVPDIVWDDAMVVMQAAVNYKILISSTHNFRGDVLKQVLILVTRCLGPLNDQRTAQLQHVMNGLVISYPVNGSRSRQQRILFKIFIEEINALVRHVDDSDSESDSKDDSWREFSCELLTPDGVVFVARAARHGGVSLDPPRGGGPAALVAPLFVCAQLIAKPCRPITEKSQDDLRHVMELLVEEGGAHWDAADNTHNTAVCHFDSVTVSRYMNLQCLAARVISAHITDYDVYLPPSLVNFVKLH